MSDILHEMQDTVDEHKESLGDGAYVRMCDGLKQLHKATALRVVVYHEFSCEKSGDDEPHRVEWAEKSRIMTVGPGRHSWGYAFEISKLTTDMSLCTVGQPFEMGTSICVVRSVEPYLKRARDGEAAAA